ncbi:hypothetical protein CBS115989_7510 [Aspergillus niger]|uniref:Uncharacterized protein n=1 Tax=Aspergillus niger ATCC 13496 TaxID=1353008 RepID=A0A370BM17_ASPNG|nr:uncharacterized protein BO96DRAFT_16221 [Aspergillus niger CBS 101883]KAI2815688.1 hypothetical protein CBS115989_7510 [Aspergillus niger]RDH16586.1 hypothetical protein M747DRAFT_345065 [Aspergillus niger ATCC 13496]KAI2840719.1 hypothetical protein CBS11232_9012 [Aspergillus niger]KAI2870571.1 hypothetical protein CBS115988_9269 [Aspergillus niger]KAI2881009.1 hypothetical protein CBS11852_9880 [Aspergillus niger]
MSLPLHLLLLLLRLLLVPLTTALPRELTPAQRLRKKELCEELAMRQEAEKLKRKILHEKEDLWAAREEWHREQIKALEEAKEEDMVAARKDRDEESAAVQKVVKELKSLV